MTMILSLKYLFCKKNSFITQLIIIIIKLHETRMNLEDYTKTVQLLSLQIWVYTLYDTFISLHRCFWVTKTKPTVNNKRRNTKHNIFENIKWNTVCKIILNKNCGKFLQGKITNRKRNIFQIITNTTTNF